MGNHTPKPWTFTKNDDGVRRIKAPSHAGSLMCDERYYPWCPAEDADWRLIAAAPDLLAACENFLAWVDGPDIEWGGVPETPEMEALRAAIKKATDG